MGVASTKLPACTETTQPCRSGEITKNTVTTHGSSEREPGKQGCGRDTKRKRRSQGDTKGRSSGINTSRLHSTRHGLESVTARAALQPVLVLGLLHCESPVSS